MGALERWRVWVCFFTGGDFFVHALELPKNACVVGTHNQTTTTHARKFEFRSFSISIENTSLFLKVNKPIFYFCFVSNIRRLCVVVTVGPYLITCLWIFYYRFALFYFPSRIIPISTQPIRGSSSFFLKKKRKQTAVLRTKRMRNAMARKRECEKIRDEKRM